MTRDQCWPEALYSAMKDPHITLYADLQEAALIKSAIMISCYVSLYSARKCDVSRYVPIPKHDVCACRSVLGASYL
eukprot:1142368-Pelagomonas_calceolata.AAC.6